MLQFFGRIIPTVSIILMLTFVTTSTARAQNIHLWLLFDASGSMYSKKDTPSLSKKGHYISQLNGHVEALKNPNVRRLLLNGKTFLHAVIWAGENTAYEISPKGGVAIDSDKTIDAFINLIIKGIPNRTLNDATTRHHLAIDFVLKQSNIAHSNDITIIDISTDEDPYGEDALKMKEIHTKAIGYNVVINVLAVDILKSQEEYRQLATRVRTPDGFIMTGSFENYAEAILSKILMELQFSNIISTQTIEPG